MNRDNCFLKKEYLKNLFPVIFSILGGTVNALIDSVFVSRKLGTNGLAAVNISMPVYLIICTLGSLIAAGSSLKSSQSAGDDNIDEAAEYYHTALTFDFFSGIFLTVLGLFICRPLSVILSQNGELRLYIFQYCLVLIAGTLPTVFSYMPIYYLQLEGKTKSITVSMIIMIGMDIFFDWLFMYFFSFGMYGAAYASLISCIASCVYSFIEMERGHSNYHFRFCRIKLSELWNIIRFGSPAALGNFLDALKLLFLNSMILHSGGSDAAAVWAILNSVSELSLSITSGVPQAALPMMGAYYTARENSGLRILVNLQVKYGLILSSVFFIAIIVLNIPLKHIFNSPTSLLMPFICLGLFIIFDILCSIWITFFHASGKLLLSNVFVICRKLFFPVASASVVLFTSQYIWTFITISGFLSVFAGFIITGCIYRKYKNTEHYLSGILLLDDFLEREKKVLDFSILPENKNICSASEQIIDFCRENNMNSKQTMRLELAIEELLTVIVKNNSGLKSVDLRAFAIEQIMGIRIRCAGNYYNPFEPDSSSDDEMMGIEMIKKMSDDVNFTYSFGMNIINISFALNTPERN